MNEADKLQALDTYFRLMSMKGTVEVFHAAGRAGVLKAVAGGAATTAAIATNCGLDPRATDLLLKALCALGLVTRTDAGYSPAPVLQFLTGTYEDLSSQYWTHLPAYLKSGRPLQQMDDPVVGMKAYAAQAGSLYWMMLPAAMAAAKMLGIGGALKNLQILDVGAGSGVWSLTFAQHDAGARVTAVDWPAVLQIASEVARKNNLADRFSARPGDYHAVELEAARYDLAIVGNVAHLETEARLTALFRRLHTTLKPDGSLLVIDVFHGQTSGELNAALYELGLALRTNQGRVHGRDALEQCVREGGFAGGAYQPIPVTPYTMGLIIAQKGT